MCNVEKKLQNPSLPPMCNFGVKRVNFNFGINRNDTRSHKYNSAQAKAPIFLNNSLLAIFIGNIDFLNNNLVRMLHSKAGIHVHVVNSWNLKKSTHQKRAKFERRSMLCRHFWVSTCNSRSHLKFELAKKMLKCYTIFNCTCCLKPRANRAHLHDYIPKFLWTFLFWVQGVFIGNKWI